MTFTLKKHYCPVLTVIMRVKMRVEFAMFFFENQQIEIYALGIPEGDCST